MVTIIFYLNLGPKYTYEYVAYDKGGETQWECDDQVWDEIDGKDYKDYAIEICNDNPSCKYIGVKELKIPGGNVTEFQVCTALRNSYCLQNSGCLSASVLQKKGGPYENFGYQELNVGGYTKWKCDRQTDISTHANFDDAVKACDQNPLCNYIENEDCSGQNGYQTCTDFKNDGKSCTFEKKSKCSSKIIHVSSSRYLLL